MIYLFGLADIFHINKVDSGRQSAILNLIELKFLREHSSVKSHILFYNNDQLFTIFREKYPN